MKPPRSLASLALLVAALPGLASAHQHIEVGATTDPVTGAPRLVLVGASSGIALLVLRGEPFSSYLPQFPGGAYPTELTFSCEGNATPFPEGSLARVELRSVSGPPGTSFSFWEVGATGPTWTRATGWTASGGDAPSLAVYEDETGYGHLHGRAFSVSAPGVYVLTFRAVDDAGVRAPSADFTYTLQALMPPDLGLRVQSGNHIVRFVSRSFTTYDLQISTDLRVWTTHPLHQFVPGTGGVLEFADPIIPGRTQVFYRLVEYL